MDLIDRATAIEYLGEEPLRWNNTIAEGQEWNDWKYHVNAIKSVPSVPAVPLDKLCEWMERYATMDCDGCREAIGSCEDEENQEVSVCNSRERWKAMLTKWMEGLDGKQT